MTDDRDKSSRAESVARTTARDVPYTRGAESEQSPQGQRPGQLPRDPTYEAELAQVDLAVLRNPERRSDPSTKPDGRRGHELPISQSPESVTPESPGARAAYQMASGQSPEPPSSEGRAVASGTLLSIGAVDPRGKTERTLETPRMFFSQQDAAGEAYFRPGKIPAVTVHQTLETETVKLSDSIDPRRAKTLPRIDRGMLQQLAGSESPESAAPMMLSGPASSLDVSSAPDAERWNQREFEAQSASLQSDYDGQIHASLSPFRDQAEPSYGYDGAPTYVEPLAGRRDLDTLEEPVALPDASTIPTQRDLPAHRIEASQPPPAPVTLSDPGSAPESAASESEGPRPTTASIAAEEPEPRRAWVNYLAFAAALLFAVVVGLLLTRRSEPQQAVRFTAPVGTPSVAAVPVDAPRALVAPAPEAAAQAEPQPVRGAEPAAVRASEPAAKSEPPQVLPKKPAAPAPAGEAPRKPSSGSPRETIF